MGNSRHLPNGDSGLSPDTLSALKNLVRETQCPWNPNQSPDWHLLQWRESVIYEIEKYAKQIGKAAQADGSGSPRS